MPTAPVTLELLRVLDALLQEESVTGAARRAHLTTPAMSRALSRVRAALGDPVLVRAGRKMVPSRRALAMRDRVRAAVAEAEVLLSETPLSARDARRVLVIRANDSIGAMLASELALAAHREAPGLTFRFVSEGNEDVESLREGWVDLDIGAVDFDAPEIRSQVLLRDRFVGVVRKGHPLASGRVTAKRFAAHDHVVVARRARLEGPIDVALERAGLSRRIVASVTSFHAALFIAARSDLVVSVPGVVARHAAETLPVVPFAVPFELPAVPISQAWHPREDVDPVHRWLRKEVKRAAAQLA
ncbi:MAG: LysR family transcriptional regulator [Polyangiaceae bacterium]|nr:LysR family transcriptional regulator [Polyangiaceae bacterium]